MNFSYANLAFPKLGWKQIEQAYDSDVIDSCLHKIPPLYFAFLLPPSNVNK